MLGEHEKKSRGGHGERGLLEEVEREEGEHGTTSGLLFGVLRIRKRQMKTHEIRRMEKEQRQKSSARLTEMTKHPEGGILTSSMCLRRWYAPQLESTCFGCSGERTSLEILLRSEIGSCGWGVKWRSLIPEVGMTCDLLCYLYERYSLVSC